MAVTLAFVVSPAASAATIDFKALADGAAGESAWNPLPFTIGSLTLSITAEDNGAAAFAYLDAGTAGLGVCQTLVGPKAPNNPYPGDGSNLCNPSSNDNVTTDESLHFVFNQNVAISGIWFNTNHDDDFSLTGNTINIGGLPFLFAAGDRDITFGNDWKAGPFAAAANTSFDISFVDEQFYVSKIEFTSVPEPASALGTGLGIIGLALLRRRRNR
jgi:hypothetical protein